MEDSVIYCVYINDDISKRISVVHSDLMQVINDLKHEEYYISKLLNTGYCYVTDHPKYGYCRFIIYDVFRFDTSRAYNDDFKEGVINSVKTYTIKRKLKEFLT